MKDMKIVTKEKFIKEIIDMQEGNGSIIHHPNVVCIEWGKINEKKPTKKIFRW